MRSLYLIRGPLCRPWLARPPQVLKRYKFSGRTEPVERSKTLLPKTPARTRFAPSPTGYVHIGSLRTALYNYLLAKATGGQFLLRVEDTDQSRIVNDAEKRLFEDLKWTGLSWDEGPDVGGNYGPYKQSERLKLYTKHAERLIGEGLAYRCFCTPEDLDQMKSISIQEGKQPIYNGTCLHISPDVSERRAANGEPHCVRFKCGRQPVVNDLVYGHYKKSTLEDDFVIIKRDGYPTYHFANVIDDHLMEITHVIRGAEWLVSTPRHVALYEAFGWQTPLFAHVGLIVNEERQKLSKRHGDIDIASWRDRGILPITLLNYVMLLGWSMGRGFKGKREAMDLDEMVEKFNLNFTKGDITINSKHEFLQKSHIKRLAQSHGPSHVSGILSPALLSHVQKYHNRDTSADQAILAELGPITSRAQTSDGAVSEDYLRQVLEIDIQNYKDAESYVARNRFLIWQVPEGLYRASLKQEIAAVDQIFTTPEPNYTEEEETSLSEKNSHEEQRLSLHIIPELVATLRSLLQNIPESKWTQEGIEAAILPFLRFIYATPKKEHDLKTISKIVKQEPQLWGYHLLRWIVAASRPGPALIPSLVVLGKEETMRRVDLAYEVAKSEEEERSTPEAQIESSEK
ncbi:hypothetical protein F5Y11DRAFT_143351 [Daldinia sp. FL1419]|nr:hypothetical protein F5Y11DRAFT_143351 [Daldinia sp. FL1419]